MIPVQAAIGGKIIARETIKGFKRCIDQDTWWGATDRKRKLLEKQKKVKQDQSSLKSRNTTRSIYWCTKN